MVPGDGRMRYRMNELSLDQQRLLISKPRISVIIGSSGIRLNVIESSWLEDAGTTIAVRDDIDPIAFRKAVLDLYANFPSNR